MLLFATAMSLCMLTGQILLSFSIPSRVVALLPRNQPMATTSSPCLLMSMLLFFRELLNQGYSCSAAGVRDVIYHYRKHLHKNEIQLLQSLNIVFPLSPVPSLCW